MYTGVGVWRELGWHCVRLLARERVEVLGRAGGLPSVPILTRSDIVRHGREITVDGRRQIPTWWEISLRGWEKVFRHIGHLVCHIHRIGGNFPSPFLSVCLRQLQKDSCLQKYELFSRNFRKTRKRIGDFRAKRKVQYLSRKRIFAKKNSFQPYGPFLDSQQSNSLPPLFMNILCPLTERPGKDHLIWQRPTVKGKFLCQICVWFHPACCKISKFSLKWPYLKNFNSIFQILNSAFAKIHWVIVVLHNFWWSAFWLKHW